MRSNLCAVFLFVFFWKLPSEARLGETQDQLVARYGPGIDNGLAKGDELIVLEMFHKDGWIITVKLINGISVGESFQNATGPAEADVKILLTLNSQGHTWTQKVLEKSLLQMAFPMAQMVSKAWVRDDGAYAFLPHSPYCLTIQSRQLLDAEAATDGAASNAKQCSLKSF